MEIPEPGETYEPRYIAGYQEQGPQEQFWWLTLAKAGSTGEGKSWEPQTAQATVGQGPWKTMLLTGIQRVCTSWDAPLQGASVTRLGGMVRRRQRHHSGLWCDVFTTELKVERGVDIRSLTARKHTVGGRKGGNVTNVTITSFYPAYPFLQGTLPSQVTTKALQA